MAKRKGPQKTVKQNTTQKTKDLKNSNLKIHQIAINRISHLEPLLTLSHTKHETVRLLLISKTADINDQSGLCEYTDYNLNMIAMTDEQEFNKICASKRCLLYQMCY